MRKDALRCIDQLLRNLMDTPIPFGNKVILLGGDFRQTLPVVPNANIANIIGNSLPSTALFYNNFKITKLHKNMRAAQ